MSEALMFVGIGFVLLYGGGEALVRGAEAIALRLGMSSLLVGLTVVAFATSSPELVVSIKAGFEGHGDVAIGNVVGSNICNIGLILGLAALIKPVRTQIQLIKIDVPILIMCSIVLLYLLNDQLISRLEGISLFAGIVLYLIFSIWQARREKALSEEQANEELPKTTSSTGLSFLLIIIGVAALVVGGSFFVDGAVIVARSFGVSEAVIGLTLVALGTSLPELAATLIATFKGKADIAVGNAIGSSIFNLLAILGVGAAVFPLAQGAITTIDVAVMIGFAVLLLPLLFSRLSLSRWEGGLMVVCYVGYMVWLTLLN